MWFVGYCIGKYLVFFINSFGMSWLCVFYLCVPSMFWHVMDSVGSLTFPGLFSHFGSRSWHFPTCNELGMAFMAAAGVFCVGTKRVPGSFWQAVTLVRPLRLPQAPSWATQMFLGFHDADLACNPTPNLTWPQTLQSAKHRVSNQIFCSSMLGNIWLLHVYDKLCHWRYQT